MIDAAKYADLVLLMVDGGFGFEMETFEFLNLLQVQDMSHFGSSFLARLYGCASVHSIIAAHVGVLCLQAASASHGPRCWTFYC